MKQSIDAVYQSYFNDIYRYLLYLCRDHHAAEDLVQETFVRAYLYLEHYEGEKVKPWLFTVAHNAFIDYIRKQSRVRPKGDKYLSALPDKQISIEDKIVTDEQITEIISLLENIPEKLKYALLLHDFHQLNYNEAASVMNVSLSHFKILLYRARQAIRKKKGGENT